MTSADEELNKRLQELVTQAQQASVFSQRRIALNKLITAIDQSGRLSRLGKWNGVLYYDELYNEAKSETFMEICRKIDNYNPQYPVMVWANQILKWRFSDLTRKERKRGLTNLPKGQKSNTIPSLDKLELDIASSDNSDEDMVLLREFIADDPDNVLKSQHIKNRPEATFQSILLMICDSQSWNNISNSLGVPVPTASSFYQRCLTKFLPYLQNSLQ